MTNLVMNEKGEVFDSARDIADEIDSQTLLEMHLDSLTFNHLQNVVITEDFIRYRNDLVKKFPAYGRSPDERLVSGDALVIEYILPKVDKEVQEATHMGHDIILQGKKIDIKIIRGNWFTVSNGKDQWYNKCIHGGDLEYFAFFSYTKAHSKPFVAGDRTSLRFIKLVPARNVMYNLRRSRYNGYYYDMRS